MHKLAELREQLNVTQEELSQKSGVSVRTIQRIESGQKPKGFTLKALASALEVDESYFDAKEIEEYENSDDLKWNKIVNLSSLPFILIPPLNILVPLAIIKFKEQNNSVNQKLVSIQIVWTMISILLFILILIMNDWLLIKSNFKMLIPILWTTLNGILIIKNALALSKIPQKHIFPDINLL